MLKNVGVDTPVEELMEPQESVRYYMQSVREMVLLVSMRQAVRRFWVVWQIFVLNMLPNGIGAIV